MKERNAKRLAQAIKDMAVEYGSFSTIQTTGPAGSSARFKRAFRRAVKLVYDYEQSEGRIPIEEMIRKI